MPQARLLALHDPVDDDRQVVPRRDDDLLGDLVGLELVEELLGAPDLGDAAVDGEAPHLGRARRDDPLPADAAQHHARDLLELAGQQADERLGRRHLPPLEVDGIEQHEHAGPVGDIADHSGDDRNAQQRDGALVHGSLTYPGVGRAHRAWRRRGGPMAFVILDHRRVERDRRGDRPSAGPRARRAPGPRRPAPGPPRGAGRPARRRRP